MDKYQIAKHQLGFNHNSLMLSLLDHHLTLTVK